VVFFLFTLIINHPHLKEIIMSSTTVTRGNSHETFYVQLSLTPTAVTTATTSAQTFSLPGLQTTDLVQVFGVTGNQTTGISIAEADCLTASIITIQFVNAAATDKTPVSGVYTIEVVRLEGPAPATAV
jgi:hypothetical protein